MESDESVSCICGICGNEDGLADYCSVDPPPPPMLWCQTALHTTTAANQTSGVQGYTTIFGWGEAHISPLPPRGKGAEGGVGQGVGTWGFRDPPLAGLHWHGRMTRNERATDKSLRAVMSMRHSQPLCPTLSQIPG